MECFFALKSELKEQFCSLVKNRASEERFIEFIRLALLKSNKFDAKALDVILDLTVTLPDNTELEYESSCFMDTQQDSTTLADRHVIEPVAYEADDEGLEESYIFPCHITFDDCHPDLLHNYHGEHIKAAKTPSQIIRYPRLVEFAIEFLFTNLRMILETFKASSDAQKTPIKKINSPIFSTDVFFSDAKGKEESQDEDSAAIQDLDRYLDTVSLIIKKLTNICQSEKKNCRILSRTRVLELILQNTALLICHVPDKQDIYLDTLLKFAFTLADYKITGDNLRQLFTILKDENADLSIVLTNFDRLLNHHNKISRNIQPLESLNFPTASKTAEEIKANTYVSNSWHWRLREKVIEFKKKRSRNSDSQSAQEIDDVQGNFASRLKVNNPISPSWLECSLIVPLSNISPLIQHGGVQLCCSLWMSVCGDMLVIEQTKKANKVFDNLAGAEPTRSAANWHWVRLTSGKRAAKRHRDKRERKNSKSKSQSIKLNRRQAHDKEDEDREEAEDKVRRSELEDELANYSGYNGFRFLNSSTSQIRTKHLKQRQKKLNQKPSTIAPSISEYQNPPKEFLGRRARDNSQKVLMHLVSFAVDTLTIEIWLNVKCMTFCARACRVAREGQTNLLDQVTFPSHLQADGSWSNIVFCLNETNKTGALHERIMNLKVVVNGRHKEKEELVYNYNPKNPPNNFACLVGCERSTFGYVWKLSQINVYRNSMPKDMPIYLLGKGPDFWSFTNYGQSSSLALPDIVQRNINCLLDPKLLSQYDMIREDLALSWLTQNIVVTYVAHQPDYFLDYSSLMTSWTVASEFSNSAERFIQARVLNFSRNLKINTNHSFGSALVSAGGIEGVLVCFADIIRRSHDSADTHSLAFSLLLKLSQSNHYHLSKFLDELSGLKLAEFILVHPSCLVTKQLCEQYLDFCLARKDDFCLIKSPALVHHLMSCWRAWHKDVTVAKCLYKKLIRIIQPADASRRLKAEERKLEDYYIKHNLRMMTTAGCVDILMGTLRECLIPLDQLAPAINHELIDLMVNLISLLIKHPPGLDVIMDIMEFLLLLHPDPKAYVETVSEKTSFLYKLHSEHENIDQFDDQARDARTPLSDTSSDFEYPNPGSCSESSLGPKNSHSRSSTDIFGSIERSELVSRDGSVENLTRYIKQYNLTTRRDAKKIGKFPWINEEIISDNDKNEYDLGSLQQQNKKDDLGKGQKCSNRNYAIANIADMLASIVKLTLTDPMKVLSEALLKQIIDPRKLIILAYNSSSLVREKILRLFLYCIRACYSLNLKPVLNKYEHAYKGYNIKLCMPTQLMARQLLKYPTTIKMIQLCYGIIVGIDDFETVDTVCLTFDIETVNNGLQLNTLILLVQLMTMLQEPNERVVAIRFVYAYIRKLMRMDEDESLKVLIENNMIDSLMRLYFTNLEQEIAEVNDKSGVQCQQDVLDQHSSKYDEVRDELDKTLILIVRYFLQNLPTTESIRNIDSLLTYLDLLNTYVPTIYKSVLRDRKVLILITAVRYLQHYAESARQRKCGGKMEYYLKSLFKNDNLNTFINILPDSQFELSSMLNDRIEEPTSTIPIAPSRDELSENELQGDAHQGTRSTNLSTDSYFNDDLRCINDVSETRKISDSNVIERFKSTLGLTINLITMREPGVIPSPLERRYTINVIKMLSCYLDDLMSLPIKEANKKSHWSLILPKLDQILKLSFSRLILFLLSPCESMNLDERKYFATQILQLFDVDHLLSLLDDSSGITVYQLLIIFVKDLIDYDGSEEGNCDQDGEIFYDDTEDQLRSLARRTEQLLAAKTDLYLDKKQRLIPRLSNGSSGQIEAKVLEIWMSDYTQTKEEIRDKIALFRSELRMQDDFGNDDTADKPDKMLDEALQITRIVVNDKHEQRKAYLEDLKQKKMFNYHTRQQWLSLIIGQTHERATWFMENYHPNSWELNPVEGPSRIRRRLRSCKLLLDARYTRRPKKKRFLGDRSEQTEANLSVLADDWHSIYSPHPLCSMIINNEQSMDTSELRTRMFTTDKIHFNCDCSIVRPNEVCDGEVSIASWCIHFIGQRSNNYQQHLTSPAIVSRLQGRCKSTYLSNANQSSRFHSSSAYDIRDSQNCIQRECTLASAVVEDLWFDEIVEIWDRRYQLRDVGLEIFLTNNMTYLLSFRSNQDREDFKQNLTKEQSKMYNFQKFNQNTSLDRITHYWREGRLTNFDFLTYLNKLAGRSFNDLMQYPIFPFVLSNYTSTTIDMNLSTNFRDLKKPMAIQNAERETTFANNYKDSQSSNLSVGVCGMRQPYHYGNHYSNSATVLHFLVRVPPFTQMHVQYQDNNFDQPDRMFHSLANTWQLITRDSNTDFKELIPEFYFLPEMFINFEQFDLGVKQNNEIVDDVKLPPWCPESDARLFTLIHRQALESQYVTENLNDWIDLIFGYKQTGKAAVDAMNVFHPATYFGFIDDLMGQQNPPTASSSTTQISSVIANFSTRIPTYGSNHVSTMDMSTVHQSTTGSHISNDYKKVSVVDDQIWRQQADIERLALETMIKTYGQMPRQLFSQPLKSRTNQPVISTREFNSSKPVAVRLEPLKQVRGLRWGSYVGSPDEEDIVVAKHRRIYPNDIQASSSRKPSLLQLKAATRVDLRYKLCLLPNGDIAILKYNTSLMLNYSADKKSSSVFQLHSTSAKYIKRAGLKSVARMNLFSSMVISRQQFSYVEPPSASVRNVDAPSANLASSMMSTNPRSTEFTTKSLSLVSWFYLDGIIRVRHQANLSRKPTLPLVQADFIVDQMSTCTTVPDLNLLLVGYRSGAICAHIISTSHKYVPVLQHDEMSSSNASAQAQASNSAAPSAVHFLHTTTNSTSLSAPTLVCGGKVDEAYSPISLAGKTLQSVPYINKTTRWLHCHSKRINCMQINVNFGIVVTGSDDGTSVIWDLNSLTYVRTIDYKIQKAGYRFGQATNNKQDHLLDYLCNCSNLPLDESSEKKPKRSELQSERTYTQDPHQSCICQNGVSLIAISNTLGDIVTIKDVENRIARTRSLGEMGDSDSSGLESVIVDEESMDEHQSEKQEVSVMSILYCHTINGSLVSFANCHSKVTAVAYSNAAEGVSVNVIVVGLDDGLIRLYSSWDLTRLKEFHVSGLASPISSLVYSRDNQLLYVAYQDGQILALRNKGKTSIAMPKEWHL